MEIHIGSPLMETDYLIGMTKPSFVIQAGHLLKDYSILPVIPLYRKVVREGALRQKVTKTFQVIPGMIFIHRDSGPMAQALLSPLQIRLNWMKRADGHFAICHTSEIRPLFEWAKKAEAGELPEAPRAYEGQKVWVTKGPMTGLHGYLVRGATDGHHWSVTFPQQMLTVELPKDWLSTQKTSCNAPQGVPN